MNRNLKIGHTAITWDGSELEQAIIEIGSSGYWGTETFGWELENWERNGRDLSQLLDSHCLNLTSMYVHLDIVKPDKRQEGIHKAMEWVSLYQKIGGNTVVVGGAMQSRKGFQFSDHLPHMIDTLNEIGARIADKGMYCCFHPHTDTAVETEDEIHAIFNKIDSRVVQFGPDLGQIAKGGSDPLRLVQEYYELIRVVHLKDYIGGPVERDRDGREIDKTGFLSYVPLGMGTVDIKGVLDYLENRAYAHSILVELDGNQWSPNRKGNPIMNQTEAVESSKRYLRQLGYDNFRMS
ncbi:sugar phosphate isomerase/epimerase family protein [Paenibacillus sp. CAU 1782]